MQMIPEELGFSVSVFTSWENFYVWRYVKALGFLKNFSNDVSQHGEIGKHRGFKIHRVLKTLESSSLFIPTK